MSQADLRAGEMQLILDQRRGGRQISAVDVVDKNSNCELRHNGPANGSDSKLRGRRGGYHCICILWAGAFVSDTGVPFILRRSSLA